MMSDDPSRLLSNFRGFTFRLARPVPEHLPDRPSWKCRECGDAWPCARAKESLRAEYGPYCSTLVVYLHQLYSDALSDLAPDVPPDLYRRIVLWAR